MARTIRSISLVSDSEMNTEALENRLGRVLMKVEQKVRISNLPLKRLAQRVTVERDAETLLV